MTETWRHARWFEPHEARPDLSRTYIQGGTGNMEAQCLTCADGEALYAERVVRHG